MEEEFSLQGHRDQVDRSGQSGRGPAKSKNLKETYIKSLRKAVMDVRFGTDALMSRAMGAPSQGERNKEIEVLRLREEVCSLFGAAG